MSAITAFRLEFDRPGATYAPGEHVTGHILIHLTKEKQFRGLNLSVKGEANVLWHVNKTERDSNGNTRTRQEAYRGSERYFSSTFLVLGGQGSEDRIKIPEGFHQYPFDFHLPTNIPSSFEHRHGHIRYTVKAVIDRPWKFDHECKAAFTVIAPLDLNANQSDCLGIHDELSKSFCFFCCCNSGSLKGSITIPVSGVVPGQSIDPRIHFNNLASTVDVTKVCTKLVQNLTFHAKHPAGRTKTESLEIKSTRSNGPFGKQDQVQSPIVVPAVAPSRLQFCNIIDQQYYLQVCIHFTGCHSKIMRKYPILIGTVPLYVPSAPSFTNTTEYPPSAPSKDFAMGGAAPPYPYPPTGRSSTADFAGPSTSGQAMGFVPPRVSGPPYPTSQWDIPPPSYEECVAGAQHESIREEDENEYVHGANQTFVPRYPVFSIPPPNMLNK